MSFVHFSHNILQKYTCLQLTSESVPTQFSVTRRMSGSEFQVTEPHYKP